jgi:hypothetical protein
MLLLCCSLSFPSQSSMCTDSWRAGLRNRHSHRDICSDVCGRLGYWETSPQLLVVFFFIGTFSSPSWWCPFFLGSASSTSRWTFEGQHSIYLFCTDSGPRLRVTYREWVWSHRCLEHGSLHRVHLCSQID